MDIKIKRIGCANGTVGWLAAGLENGTLTLIEFTLKANGHHGLWLKGHVEGNAISQFLAAYNQYALTPADYDKSNTYEPADGFEDRLGLWTDAAWETLLRIARAWCDECNALLATEGAIDIHIARIVVQDIIPVGELINTKC